MKETIKDSFLDKFNVVWKTPSKSSSGSMPIGNGDIGLNVWVEENGDLLFYIGKTDAWNENCQLLKLGLIRVRLRPNPLEEGCSFLQLLKLRQGEIKIVMGKEQKQINLCVWVDANRPVIRVEVKGKQSFDLEVNLHVWRTEKRELRGTEAESARGLTRGNYPIIVYPDTIMPAKNERIVWYHRNEKSCYPITFENQHLGGLLAKYPDPLMHRTFGGCIKSKGLKSIDSRTLKSAKPSNRFMISIYLLTAQTKTADAWMRSLNKLITRVDGEDLKSTREAHHAWWDKFWKRSWIFVSGSKEADIVTRGYILQRWINACGGRGAYPIKFNGSIFTVDAQVGEEHFDADYRRWGEMYWWQNTRLIYWSMLASGDFDLMQPLFRMYKNASGLCKDKTRMYYQHDGVFFPETMYFWGTVGNCDFGWGHKGPETRNQYIRRYWQGGIELTALMLEYYAIMRDDKFFRKTALPIVNGIATFFDQHWERTDGGKIRFEPSQALETWLECVNPLPEIAGLKYTLGRLLDLPKKMTSKGQRKVWQRILSDLPEVPSKVENNKRFLLPAEKYSRKANTENPELYAIFPYRLFGVGKPELDIILETWRRRCHKGTGCWRQDAIHSAYLGLKKEAAHYVIYNFSEKDFHSRFDAFWGPNFDWIPDQDHGCVASIALQRMLLQCEDKKILLLPAWPKNWDVDFKLHASMNTTVEGQYRNGNLQKLKVTPRSRLKDVKLIL